MAVPTSLVIDAEARQKARWIIDHAKTYPITFQDILDMRAKRKLPIGNDPKFVLELPIVARLPGGQQEVWGFQVVYSRDQQPGGMCHHLSVSSYRKDRHITPAALQMIFELFDIRQNLMEAVATWNEEPAPDHEGGPIKDVLFLVKPEEDATDIQSSEGGDTARVQ